MPQMEHADQQPYIAMLYYYLKLYLQKSELLFGNRFRLLSIGFESIFWRCGMERDLTSAFVQTLRAPYHIE